jgi:hypothetical protein
MALARYKYAMTEATHFICPTCEARYRLVPAAITGTKWSPR